MTIEIGIGALIVLAVFGVVVLSIMNGRNPELRTKWFVFWADSRDAHVEQKIPEDSSQPDSTHTANE